MNSQDPVQAVLSRISAKAGCAGQDLSYQDLLAPPELPIESLAEVGSLTRLDSGGGLPSLLVESGTGQAQIELCPFGPLALISSDGNMDTDPIAQALVDAGIAPLFPGDLDQADPWHGAPLARWLFPQKLADALALFDSLSLFSGPPDEPTRAVS